MDKAKYQILNSFAFKIIATLTMTLDHIGIMLISYGQKILSSPMTLTGDIFRIIGRLSFPLIALLLAEAMRHTKDRTHYLYRLGFMSIIVLATQIGLRYGLNMSNDGNIFLTLLASASFIYLFELKDNKRYLFLIPLAYIILSFAVDIQVLYVGVNNTFLPSYLKASYSLYGFILCVGFYFVYRISDKRCISLTKGEKSIESLREYPYYRSFTNISWALLLLFVNVFFWLISYIPQNLDMYNMSLQSYSLITIIPILLYNGNKGYSSKKIQYSFYFYYPIHIVIIFVTFYLIFGALV